MTENLLRETRDETDKDVISQARNQNDKVSQKPAQLNLNVNILKMMKSSQNGNEEGGEVADVGKDAAMKMA